jgi:hypothetical protein
MFIMLEISLKNAIGLWNNFWIGTVKKAVPPFHLNKVLPARFPGQSI